MTFLCYTLAAAVLALAGVCVWLEYAHRVDREKNRAVINDLLDRVMARSYGEYVASTRPVGERPKHRKVLSDEELALLESQRVGETAK